MTKIPTLALATLLLVTTEAQAALTKGRPLKTGQTTTYGAAGDTTAGLSRMYNDLGNGVIKDQRTGLFWEKKSDDGGVHDKDNTYTWSTGNDSFNGTAKTVFLAILNSRPPFLIAPCFGGFCDWRLPTLNELETIRDLDNLNPAVPAVFNTSCTAGCTVTTCSCTRSSYYWSSSTSQNSPSLAWGVVFGSGYVYDFSKSNDFFVRAVRSGS